MTDNDRVLLKSGFVRSTIENLHDGNETSRICFVALDCN